MHQQKAAVYSVGFQPNVGYKTSAMHEKQTPYNISIDLCFEYPLKCKQMTFSIGKEIV